MDEGCILDPSWIHLEGEFEEQVQSLFSYVRLSREEVENLRFLFSDVENTLRTTWLGCEVIPFGSIVTGMGIKTSDVDCYVYIPIPPYTMLGEPNTIVMKARNVLRKRSNIFAQLFAITTAKVPIVKFYHVPTRRNCDLSFKSPSGVRNSKLICYLLHLDKRAQDLAILVKYWSKVHHLTGTNLMPNYALTLLVIFYLQHLDIVPPVCKLQQTMPHNLVDGWNTAFEEYGHLNENEWSLHQILGGFFAYYSTYNFSESIISPYLGYSIVRESFKKLSDVPEEFQLYKENLRRKVCMPLKLDTALCVQDPFDHSRNCSVAVFPKLGHKVCEYFKMAAKMYENESSQSFLRALLTKQPEVGAWVTNKAKKAKLKGVLKSYRPNNNYKTMKNLKNIKNNTSANTQTRLHALYAQINSKQKRKM